MPPKKRQVGTATRTDDASASEKRPATVVSTASDSNLAWRLSSLLTDLERFETAVESVGCIEMSGDKLTQLRARAKRLSAIVNDPTRVRAACALPELPTECWHHIVSFLDSSDLGRMRATCTLFRQLANEFTPCIVVRSPAEPEAVWQERFERFPSARRLVIIMVARELQADKVREKMTRLAPQLWGLFKAVHADAPPGTLTLQLDGVTRDFSASLKTALNIRPLGLDGHRLLSPCYALHKWYRYTYINDPSEYDGAQTRALSLTDGFTMQRLNVRHTNDYGRLWFGLSRAKIFSTSIEIDRDLTGEMPSKCQMAAELVHLTVKSKANPDWTLDFWYQMFFDNNWRGAMPAACEIHFWLLPAGPRLAEVVVNHIVQLAQKKPAPNLTGHEMPRWSMHIHRVNKKSSGFQCTTKVDKPWCVVTDDTASWCSIPDKMRNVCTQQQIAAFYANRKTDSD